MRHPQIMASSAPALPLIVDLNSPLPAIDARPNGGEIHYGSALCLAILDGEPLAKAHLSMDGQSLSAAQVGEQLWDQLGSAIFARRSTADHGGPTALPLTGLPPVLPVEQAPRSSVADITAVIATRNRTESLRTCLESIWAGTVQPDRLVVVDNAPSSETTAELVEELRREHPSLRYVREDVPGLACAHNAALPHVSSRYVAFTDDDVLVDSRWLERLVMAFSGDDQVACVTGMIAPRELDTLPQQWIEGNVTYDKGLYRRVFDSGEHRPDDPLFPYTAGAFGSGANMAFRADFLNEIGGFDEALGAGTIAMGGDDLAAFYDVVTNGYRLVYEPAAIVLHQHHREYAALKRQTYGYGAGLGAHLTRCLLDDPRAALVLLLNAPRALRRAARIIAPPTAAGLPPYPRELSREQWRGLVSGPFRLVRSRRRARKNRKAAR